MGQTGSSPRSQLAAGQLSDDPAPGTSSDQADLISSTTSSDSEIEEIYTADDANNQNQSVWNRFWHGLRTCCARLLPGSLGGGIAPARKRKRDEVDGQNDPESGLSATLNNRPNERGEDVATQSDLQPPAKVRRVDVQTWTGSRCDDDLHHDVGCQTESSQTDGIDVNGSANTISKPEMAAAVEDQWLDHSCFTNQQTIQFFQSSHVMVIARGLPGSGKSTLVRSLSKMYPRNVVCSADDFFMGEDGVYNFNASLLKDAHQWCQSQCRDACSRKMNLVIVDNTNVKRWEMGPYFGIASSHGYAIVLLEPHTPWARDPTQLALKNSHQVSFEVIQRRLEDFEIFNPRYLGWFLNSADSKLLVKVAKDHLFRILASSQEVLKDLSTKLGMGNSHQITNKYSRTNCSGSSQQILHCTSKFFKKHDDLDYIQSPVVENSLGQASIIKIVGFTITDRTFGARILLSDQQLDLWEQNDNEQVFLPNSTAGIGPMPAQKPSSAGDQAGQHSGGRGRGRGGRPNARGSHRQGGGGGGRGGGGHRQLGSQDGREHSGPGLQEPSRQKDVFQALASLSIDSDDIEQVGNNLSRVSIRENVSSRPGDQSRSQLGDCADSSKADMRRLLHLDRMKGRRAHFTIGTTGDVKPVQTGLDQLSILSKLDQLLDLIEFTPQSPDPSSDTAKVVDMNNPSQRPEVERPSSDMTSVQSPEVSGGDSRQHEDAEKLENYQMTPRNGQVKPNDKMTASSHVSMLTPIPIEGGGNLFRCRLDDSPTEDDCAFYYHLYQPIHVNGLFTGSY